MLYLDHDFYSNFNASISSGDNELISDMLVNEMSELIVYKTEKILDLLNRVGIKTNENASDEKIVDNIISNMSNNVKLNKGLAFLIAESNDATKTKKIVKGKDGKEREMTRRSKGATIKEIDSISSGIVGIGDSFKYKPQLQKEFKIKLMKLIETKSNAVGERDRKQTENNNGKYWLLAILVVGAGVGIYFYLKNKKKMAEGGALEGVAPTVDAAPTVQAPIVEAAPTVEAIAPIVEVAPTPTIIPPQL